MTMERVAFTGDLTDDCVDSNDFRARILNVLENLYASDRIYSNIGDTIVAINPFKDIPALSTREVFNEYSRIPDHISECRNSPFKLHPHVWTVTRDAILHTLNGPSILQSIVICGESGAGKTEIAKKCLQYLASFQKETSLLESRIMSALTLIDSFGNAKTSLNNNSSRHGKWLEMYYEVNRSLHQVELTHARFNTFLLEKSRVASQGGNGGQRNYHIFYQLCANGCMDLEAANSYKYLLEASPANILEMDDRVNFEKTEDAFRNLLFTDEDIDAIFSALKCILLLGNVDFFSQHVGGSDSMESATVSDDSLMLLEEVSDRLGLDIEVLAMSFLVRDTSSGAGFVETPLTIGAASDARDSLCKEIYYRLFNSIVQQANASLLNSSASQELTDSSINTDGRSSCIGLLDIFGFENFLSNSLEQLCINYASEKMLHHFLSVSVQREQDLYLREEVPLDPLSMKLAINVDVLSLFETPTVGFFARLDAAASDMLVTTDQSLLDKIDASLNTTISVANACYLRDTNMSKFVFEIRHFASTVRYNSHGFVVKNMDSLFGNFDDLLTSSSNNAFRRIMTIPETSSSSFVTNSSSPALSSRYPSQMTQLIEVLKSSESHFIQCIKPNRLQLPAAIDKDLVLTQLNHSGILDAFQLKKNGFPLRFSHVEFIKLYQSTVSRTILAGIGNFLDMTAFEKCELICEEFQRRSSAPFSSKIVVGKTMVLAQHKAIQRLNEESQTIVVKSVCKLQSYFRMKKSRMAYDQVIRSWKKLIGLMESAKCSANFDLLVELETSVDELQRVTHQANFPVRNRAIGSAKKMMERLQRIQDLNTDIQQFLISLSGNNPESIAVDYERAQHLLSVAAELEYPSGTDLIAELIVANERLQQKTSIVKQQLQLGISDVNESNVFENTAQCVEVPSDSDGQLYSEEESLLAQNLLSEIRSERAKIHGIWEKIVNMQNSRSLAMASLLARKVGGNIASENDDSFDSREQDGLDRISVLSPHQQEMMESVELALLSLRNHNDSNPASVFGTHVYEVLEALMKIHESWYNEDWASLGIEIQELNSKCFLVRSMQSESYNEVIKLIDTGIANEVSWIADDINDNFVSPYVPSSNSESIDIHNPDELILLAEKLREFSFCGDCNTYLLKRIEFVLRLIESLQENHYETVLYVTERDVESCTARIEAYRKLKASISSELRLSEEELFFSLSSTQDMDKIQVLLKERQSTDSKPTTMPTTFQEFDRLLDERLNSMRSYAYQSFVIAVLAIVQPIRSVSEDEDKVFDASSASLTYVLEYIACTFERPPEIVLEIVQHVTQLKEMRANLCASKFNAIIGSYNLNGITSLSTHSADLSIQPILENMQKEAWIIIWHTIRRSVEPVLVALIENNLISGPFGSPSFDKEPLLTFSNQVQKIAAYCDSFTNLSGMELTDDVTALIYYSKSLAAVKMSYFVSDKMDVEELEETLQSLVTLKEQFLLLPEHLAQSRFEDEIGRLNEEIEYTKIMNTFRHAISPQEGVTVYVKVADNETLPVGRARVMSNETPFVSVAKDSFRESRSRSMLFNNADLSSHRVHGHRKRADTQFTSRLRTQSENLTVSSPADLVIDPDLTVSTSMDSQDASSIIDEVLSKDGMRLNDDALEVQPLDDALEAAEDFLSASTYAEDLPPQYYTFVHSIELLRNLRFAVKGYSWKEAYEALSQLKSEEIMSQVPEVRSEMLAAATVVNEFYLISNFTELLQKNVSAGLQYGEVDYSSINMDALQDTETLCSAIDCYNDRSKSVQRALLMLVNLRRAQKNSDWVAVSSILKVISQENLNKKIEFSNLFQLEVSRAAIERDNHENINVMKAAISEEEIPSSNGLIQFNKISTERLGAAHVKAYMVPTENRGFVFKSLFTMVEVLLKIRKNLMQKKWNEMITLLPFLQESNDAFLNMLENLDKSSGSPKKPKDSTLMKGSMSSLSPKPPRYSRLQSVRYSTIGGANVDTSSMKIPSVFWDTYMGISQLIQADINTIQTHTSVSELEDQLNTALQSNFVRVNQNGSIDISKVSITDLGKALDLKTKLESTNKLTLSTSVVQLSKSARLAFEIRQAVIEDDWHRLNSLVEGTIDGDFGFMQDCTRREIQVIRTELQNRWIISNLQDALKIGRAKGSVQKVDLTEVSCDHFESYISTAKSLNPTTEDAMKLLSSVERMSELRKLICTLISVNWNEVRLTATAILEEVDTGALSEILREELELIKAASDDTLKCDLLMVALRKGGPSGSPGSIDLSTIDTTDLEVAYNAASVEIMKTDTLTNLMNACRIVQYLRNALLQTAPLKEDALAAATWHSISLYVGMIDEYRKNHPEDESFQYCEKEITLARQHAALRNIHAALTSSVIRASHVYSERNAAAIDYGDATLQLLSTEELEDIVSSCNTIGFQNDISVQFQSCAAALKEFRSMVNSGKWIALKEMVVNVEMHKALKVVPQAERELAWIVCETNNHFVIEIVTEALKSIASPDQIEDNGPLKDVNAIVFSSENRSLEVAMSQVVNFKVTSTTAQQLLDSFSQLLRLRRALEVQNHSLIVAMLRWFRENAHVCTSFIHAEAQRCYVIYQNAQLVRHLRATLQLGKPTGPCGDLRTQSIDLDNLQRLLNQCKVIKPLTASASQVKEAAIIALGIRKALKAGDYISLRNFIEQEFPISQSNSSIHSLIVDEIAIARSELDNETVLEALLGALQSYDINTYILDGCFIKESATDIGDHYHNDVSIGEMKSIDCSESLVDKLILGRFSSADPHDRGFSYNAVDTDSLDDALEVAIRYGILSERAKRLHHTAVLVRSCRHALRCSDWVELEALLFKSAFHHGVHQGDYDSVAEKEVFIIETQVKLRSAIIDITTALQCGWANCANGIVDTTTLETDPLFDALDRAEQSLRDTYALTQVADLSYIDIESFDFKQLINKQLNELLRSGKEILHIRSCLRRGHVHEAIELINVALSYRTANTSEQLAAATLTMTELLLYSKDITIAMSVISTFDAILEDGCKSGDVGKLGLLISGVKESHPTFLNDLGLVKILFHAEEVHSKLKEIKKSLPSFEASNNRDDLLKTISIASRISPASSPSIAILEGRLAQLDKFDSLISDLASERLSYFSDRSALKHVLSYAGANCLQDHPHTVRARQLLFLSNSNFLKSAIAHAVTENNSLAAAIYTIQMKLPYLGMKSSISKYQLQSFPLLRTPAEYGVRMNVISLDLQKNMLLHTHQSLPTSLTKLSPQLAALAVWVFTHCISAIERNTYSHSDVQLTKLIRLGCSCIPMRDEIYMQLIKQTRSAPATAAAHAKAATIANTTTTTTATSTTAANTTSTTTTGTSTTADETSSRLIWTTMCLCLQSFPPSKILEPYMETYFLSKIREAKTPTSNLAKSCLVSLHQTVFKHGYKSPIESAELISTISMVSKLISDRTVLDHFRSVRSSLPKKVLEYGNSSSSISSISSSSATTNTSHESVSSFISRHLDGVWDANISLSESEVEQTDSEQAFGTRGDWETRFRQFNSSQTKLISRDRFAMCMAGFITSATTSTRDRDILCFILCGRRSVALSEAMISLRREYLGSRELFHYADDKEQAVSVGRQHWLEKHMHIATPSAEGCHIDLDRWTVTYLAGVLWDKVVSKIPQNISAGFDQDRTQSGRLRGNETLVGSPPPSQASNTGRRPFALVASSAAKSAEEDGVEEELCALISTEVDMMLYHDLIIAGMKVYCSHC